MTLIPFVHRRRFEREQHRSADAINSAINWRKHYEDTNVVCHARGILCYAIVTLRSFDYRTIEAHINASQAPDKVKELAMQELRCLGCKP